MTRMREVTWGEELLLEIKKLPRSGVKGVHADIAQLLGGFAGVRNTFAKLVDYDSPELLDPADQVRAWLMLTAMGLEPNNWGISDDVLPAAFIKPDELRRRLHAIRESRLGESNPRPIHYKNAETSVSGKIYRGRLRCAS